MPLLCLDTLGQPVELAEAGEEPEAPAAEGLPLTVAPPSSPELLSCALALAAAEELPPRPPPPELALALPCSLPLGELQEEPLALLQPPVSVPELLREAAAV